MVLIVLIITLTLREICPDMEFFLLQIEKNADQKKLRIWTLFTQSHGW